MPETAHLPIIEWANSASEQELREWIHARLHGDDRRWLEADDGYAVPSHMVALVVRHPDTNAQAYAAIVQSVCRFVREALPAWSALEDGVAADVAAAGWSAPALVDLLFLASEILEGGPRRNEMRDLLTRSAPSLPRYAGTIPLRAKALVVLVDFGGNPVQEFWLAQISDDYPEATHIAFIGMARRDLDNALAWLGQRPLEEQGEIIRMFRPSLVKLAGGETPFVILARNHVFRSNHGSAKDLRDELVPAGDKKLMVESESVGIAEAQGGRVLPSFMPTEPGTRILVQFPSWDTLEEASIKIALQQYLKEFGLHHMGTHSKPKKHGVLANIIRSIFVPPNERFEQKMIDEIVSRHETQWCCT